MFRTLQKGSSMRFYLMEIDETRDDRLRKAFKDIRDRLTARLRLKEVTSVEQCDFILAVVPVTSRAGTDLKNAVSKIPVHKPVVLSALHHTFEDRVVLHSRNIVFVENVFPVDFLYYEDIGLLRCLSNDEALKAVTDHLIHLKPALRFTHPASEPSACSHVVPRLMVIIILILICVSIVVSINAFFNR